MHFLKLTCLIASNGGALHRQHITFAMHHIHDVTKPLMTSLLLYDITWSMVTWEMFQERTWRSSKTTNLRI